MTVTRLGRNNDEEKQSGLKAVQEIEHKGVGVAWMRQEEKGRSVTLGFMNLHLDYHLLPL